MSFYVTVHQVSVGINKDKCPTVNVPKAFLIVRTHLFEGMQIVSKYS